MSNNNLNGDLVIGDLYIAGCRNRDGTLPVYAELDDGDIFLTPLTAISANQIIEHLNKAFDLGWTPKSKHSGVAPPTVAWMKRGGL